MALICALPFQNNQHHLFVNFLTSHHSHLAGEVDHQRALMNLEKFDIFEKKSDQLIVILNSVKRLDLQKLIEFLFGSG